MIKGRGRETVPPTPENEEKDLQEKDHFTANFQGYHKYSLDYINSIFFSISILMKKMARSITYSREMLKNGSSSAAVLSPFARLNIAIVIGMDRHVARNVPARNVEIRRLEEYPKVSSKAANAERVGARKSIANVSKMEENVDLIVNA